MAQNWECAGCTAKVLNGVDPCPQCGLPRPAAEEGGSAADVPADSPSTPPEESDPEPTEDPEETED